MSLQKRIQILLAFLVGVPFALLLFETYRTGRTTLLRQLRSEAGHLARLQVTRMEPLFEQPREAAESVARALSSLQNPTPKQVRDLLRKTLQDTPQAFGLAVALPHGLGSPEPFVPYVCRQNGDLRESSLASSTYAFQDQAWFSRPWATRQAGWSSPYLDIGGGEVLMITFATPIIQDGRLVGVATADVSLEQMVAELRHLRPGGEGHAYLVSQDGAVLAHPRLGKLANPASGQNLGVVRTLLDRAGEDALSATDPFTGKRAWLVELPLVALSKDRGGQTWSLVVSWPEALRTRPLLDLGKRFLVLFLALGGAAILFLQRSLNDMITRPIARLAGQAHRFAMGDFGDLGHPPEETPELRALGEAVRLLGDTLKASGEPPDPGARS